jgi:hypothetical protein
MCGAVPPLPNTSSWRGAWLSTGTSLHLPLPPSWKGKRKQVYEVTILFVCIPSQILKQWTELHEMWYELYNLKAPERRN